MRRFSRKRPVSQRFSGDELPRDGSVHPDEDTLLSYLVSDLPADAQAEIAEHLTNCKRCRKHLRIVSRQMERDLRRIEPHYAEARDQARSRLGLRPDTPRTRHEGRIRHWAEALIGSRIAWAVTSAAVACLFLAVAWGPLGDRNPTAGDDLLPRGSETSSQTADEQISWNPDGLLEEIDGYAEFPLERAIAYSIGFLNRQGVPLQADCLSFEAATAYVVKPSDTWDHVAEQLLGDPRLWPILVLLNPEEAKLGALMSGHVIRVPDHGELR